MIYDGSAKLFSEYELFAAGSLFLRLTYRPENPVEERGGLAFQCVGPCSEFELHYFRSAVRQLESYEVYSAGHLELTVEAINTFKKTDLKFADGTVWELHPHLSGYTVHDDDQVERLRATREILSFLGRAHISSDDRLERDQLLPLLIMLLHLCTHWNTSGGLH